EGQAVGLRRLLPVTPMTAAADVPPAQAPSHAVGTGQVLSVAPESLGLDTEAVQLQPLPRQRPHDDPDFISALPAADLADAYQRLSCQVDPGRLVHGHAGQVVG